MDWPDSDFDPDEYAERRPGYIADTRQTRSSNLPPIIRKLDEEDKLIDLSGPDSTAHQEFMGISPTATTFALSETLLATSELLPKSLKSDRTGIHLSFRIFGGKVAKQICISAKISGANIKKLHETKLEFHPGQIRNLRFEKVSLTDIGESGSSVDILVVMWETDGGYGTGLGDSMSEIDDESRETLKHMQCLTHDAEKKQTKALLIVKNVMGLELELTNLQKEVAATLVQPWSPYLDSGGMPQSKWPDMPKRKHVKDYSDGLIRYAPKNSFTNITEAHLTLANGTYLEYRVAPKHDLRSSWPSTDHEQLYIRRQLFALKVLFNPQASAHVRTWWNTVLNQSVERLAIRDPLDCYGEKQNMFACYSNKVRKMFPWTSEQKAAFDMSRNLHGNVGVIEGPPGSGKSQTLAGIAVTYFSSGTPVLLMAPSPAAAKVLGQAVTRLLIALDEMEPDSNLSGGLIKLYQSEPTYEDVKKSTSHLRTLFQGQKIIVTTPNAICCKQLALEFALLCDTAILCMDDADQILETEIWGAVFGLANHEKIQGVILTGDVKEWPSSVATQAPIERKCVTRGHKHYGYSWMIKTYLDCHEKDKRLPLNPVPDGECDYEYRGGQNEFAEQVGLPLISRLLRQRFPSIRLKEQHRICNDISKFPKHRLYNDLLKGKGPRMMAVDIRKFHTLLRGWLGPKTKDVDMTVIFLEASSGKYKCIKERRTTTSKRNHENVEVVYDLLVRNYKAKALDPEHIKIVTQYRDQVRLYEQVFEQRAQINNIPREALPEVITLDTLRGNQSRVIIYDLVVTCGDNSHGLGIVGNEFRANLAATRASETLIIVGSKELVDIFPGFWMWMNNRLGKDKEPLPYIVEYAKSLQSEGLSFLPPTQKRIGKPFTIKKEWIKKESGFLPWEWELHHSANYDKN